jgi:outer membrane protein
MSNMKKCLGLFVATIAALGFLGTSVQAKDFSVAIVDVPQIVNASAQVQALKKEQQAKADEMVKFIEKARKDIAAMTDADKKKAADEKYTKEFQAKKDKIDKDYAEKLKAIDASITKQIETQAKLKGYDLVLSKGFVLYGGTDITADIIKIVK